MFGLDFVLECEMEQMLNPPRVPERLNEEVSKSDRWEWADVFHYISGQLLTIITNIITITRLYANIYKI